MKGELTTMMRASEEKHFSKLTRLTDFLINLLIYLFIYSFWGGIWLSIWVNIYFSKPVRLLDNLILMQ